MSQEKVERYKEQKANRKKIMKREKRARFMRWTIAIVVFVLLVIGMGVSIYRTVDDAIPREEVEVDYTAVNDYETALNATDTEE